ncbi:MAG: acyl-CoA dehydrogenase family protein [Candidatus Binataceae bacterium]
MEFGLNEEQQQLRESVRAFLARECPTTRVRQVMADAEGMPRDLYGEIAKLGWSGLLVPEQFGGAGLGLLDMSVVLEECGYAALPGPFLFSSVIAASALKWGGSDEMKRRWLGALADGSAIGTVAIVEASDSTNPADLSTSARHDDSRWLLNGAKMFVPYAHVADFIVVAARTGARPAAVGLFVVEPKMPGVHVRMLRNLDLTRRVSAVELDGVVLTAGAHLGGGLKLYNRLCDVGSIAVAADSLGGIERALEMAVDYSRIREQFGKPIGSFQALKHGAAEIVADLEPARALLWYAAHAEDALPAEAPRAAAMVKARLCEVYSRGSDRAVLMHGGIGFTWEHDMHLWFKRARFNDAYFGAPPFHRERLAALSGY